MRELQKSKAPEAPDQKEYKQWLESIKKPQFAIPTMECNSPEERDPLIKSKAEKNIRALNQKAAEYNRWVKEVEQQHHEKMVERVQEKLAADKEFDEHQEAAAAEIAKKSLEAKRKRQEIAKKSVQEVKDMYKRVQE